MEGPPCPYRHIPLPPLPAIRPGPSAGQWPMISRSWLNCGGAAWRPRMTFCCPVIWSGFTRKWPDVYLPGVDEVWLAEEEGCPVGFLGCDGAHVEMLFVEPEYFGRGVGKVLLRHARDLHGALSPGSQRAECAGSGLLSAPRLCGDRAVSPGQRGTALSSAVSGLAGINRPAHFQD